MLFNSIEFVFFLPIVFLVYWALAEGKLAVQNFFLLAASYFFYGWWDWRFLSLIFFSTCLDFIIGLNLDKAKNEQRRKLLFWTSVFVNLGLLGVFKYFNFFVENFVEAFSFFGANLSASRLNIILPIGISFYTFQTLSYSIDIYKKRIKPTDSFIEFAAFVSFFPQLVAGPIERAANLLPQFRVKRVFDYNKAVDGMRQILWGLFKKIVIADNCAEYVNIIFNNSADYSGSTLVLGVVLFTIQVYGDFSGYSDIAIGTARLFGFNLMQNFASPYFSPNITELYRKWHISLSTWIRDYIYTPLSFRLRRMNKSYKYIVVFLITFTVFGFWHGANWTFIVFGVLQGLVLSYEYRTRKVRKKIRKSVNPTIYYWTSVFFTYCFWCFSCIFFRAESVGLALTYIGDIFSPALFSLPYIIEPSTLLPILPKKLLLFIFLFMLLEWWQKDEQYAIEKLGLNWKAPLRYGIYYGIIFLIIFYGGSEQEFIYFQF